MNEIQDSARQPGPVEGVLRRFLKWLFCLRVMSRWLFVLACLATLTGLFYAVENWRGKRAWEKCRREQEAKGEVLDWSALIPAPVPDDQNIYKAPKMAEWFVKGAVAAAVSGDPSKAGNTNAPFSLAPHRDADAGPVLLTAVDVIPVNGPLPPWKADAVLRFDDPAAHEQAVKLLNDTIGPWVEGAQNKVIVARQLDQIKPANLVVQADTVPAPTALAKLLTPRPAPSKLWSAPSLNYFQVEPAGSNAFRVSLKSPVYAAAEYLALSQPAVPDLNLLRQALDRPFARMEGSYEKPFEQPIPNFVRLRSVVQILSQRAQCYLLLGQPEAAWHELALIRNSCRMLEDKPSGNAPTIVQAMINVAISGLYTQVIADGLRLQAWREPELAAMQKQLTDINLPPLVRSSFNAEPAALCRTFEIALLTEPRKLLFFTPNRPGLWEMLKNPRLLFGSLMPRGWIYQNMCTIAIQGRLIIDLFDVPNNQVLPRRADEIKSQIDSAFSGFSPYTFVAQGTTPNFVKALQTMALNQTLANEAFIACGLERYRLARGQYPDTLEALVPQFADKLPHDIVGGQPLKYHRTANGQFVLYSVGWNGQDDGGVPGATNAEGDWVWP